MKTKLVTLLTIVTLSTLCPISSYAADSPVNPTGATTPNAGTITPHRGTGGPTDQMPPGSSTAPGASGGIPAHTPNSDSNPSAKPNPVNTAPPTGSTTSPGM